MFRKMNNNVFTYINKPVLNIKYIVKYLSLFFLDFFLLFILFFKKSNNNKTKYSASICAIFKDESRFIKEWIEYHQLIGIDHIFLYNNQSSDAFIEVLDPYLKVNYVTLINWPFEQGQFSAYKHWYDNFSKLTSWVSFLDIDEFICPFFDISIKDWLLKFKNYPCILMYWKMFGTSGKLNHDFDKLVIDQYTVSWDKLYVVGKVFYNTNFRIAIFDSTVHHETQTVFEILGLKIIIPPINEFKYFVKWNIHRIGLRDASHFTIQINHYWSKAFDIYSAKAIKSDVAFKNNPKKSRSYFLLHERQNRAVDFKIYRFLIDLKEKLNIR